MRISIDPIRPRRLLIPVLALALAATATGEVTGGARPAYGAEITPRPDSGVVTLLGHGFGHGRGMSQRGAYNAAKAAGLSWTRILAFYYPGTTRSTLAGADAALRVWISGDDDGDTTVTSITGMRVTVAGRTSTLPAGYTAWRAAKSAGATVLSVAGRDGAGVWRPLDGVGTGTDVAFTPPASAPAGITPGTLRLVRPDARQLEVRGIVHATLAEGSVRTLVHTNLDTYLRGVVAAEMPAEWHPQALAAQAVAARTYAAWYRNRQRAKGSFYDICDTTRCQVYQGVALRSSTGGVITQYEYASTDTAIAATAGTILRYGAQASIAFTEFTSSNGGWSTRGDFPYLVAQADPYDGAVANRENTWTVNLKVTSIERAYPAIGRLVRLRVLTRDGNGAQGGRVLSLALDGTAGTVTTTGEAFKRAFGLWETWFTPTGRNDLPRDLNGDGFGDLAFRDSSGAFFLVAGSAAGLPRTTSGGRPAARQIGAGWNVFNVVIAAGQWDNTGGQDVIARDRRTGELVLYTRSATGTWSGRTVLGAGYAAYRSFVAAGDINGDGYADLLAIRTATGELVRLSATASGGLRAPVVLAGGWRTATRLIVPGDITGDGVTDVLTTTKLGALRVHPGSTSGAVTAFAGFATARVLGAGWQTFAYAWSPGDITGDARPELLGLTATGRLISYGFGAGGALQAPHILHTGLATLSWLF